MAAFPSILADGISAVASHNGVHRVIFYKLTNDPSPTTVLELQLPERAIGELVSVLQKMGKPDSSRPEPIKPGTMQPR